VKTTFEMICLKLASKIPYWRMRIHLQSMARLFLCSTVLAPVAVCFLGDSICWESI